jgi:diguanylate cyclase (GGDEF)-like protein/PAS domain S-box-containing protein
MTLHDGARSSRLESVREFRALAEAMPVIVWVADADGAVIYTNKGWADYTGLPVERCWGDGWLDALHPDDRERASQVWRDAVQSGGSYANEWRMRRADGAYRWWLTRGVPQRDEGGQIGRWFGSCTDINDLKQAQTELAAKEAFIRMAGQVARHGAWAVDLPEYRLTWSDEVCAIHDVPPGTVPTVDQAIGFYTPEWRPTIALAMERCIKEGLAFDLELEIISGAGRCTAVRTIGHAVRGASGTIIRIQGAFQDISDRKAAERALHRKARQQELIATFGRLALASKDLDELHAQAVMCARDGTEAPFAKVLQLAPDGRSLVMKAGLGWAPEWMGHSIHDTDEGRYHLQSMMMGKALVVSDFSREPRLYRSGMILAHGIMSGMEVPVIGAGGLYGVLGVFWRNSRSFSADELDFLGSLANTLESAVERRATEEKLSIMAQFDALTGLPNRNMLRDRLVQAVTHARRGAWMLAVLFVDLDRFKMVNDTLGHPAGDTLLTLVARRLEQCTRPGDTVARLSGDEFAVLLCNLGKDDDAAVVAQKIVAACERPFELDGKELHVSASVGIALYPRHANPDSLLEHADIAMYRAKEQGRNRYQFYLPDMHARAVARMRTEMELRNALQRNEFVVYYQPKADLYTGEISGFEALVRWNHPDKGLVPPIEFVSVLEDTGLIVPVGEWVLSTACAQVKAWHDEGFRQVPVAVNLSPRQFQAAGLDAAIAAVLAATGLPARMLELELTESVLMEDPEEAASLLRELKDQGVHITVDDFGTGYSSLAYLKRFPLDALKIDRTFIDDCVSDADDATIALSVIRLAHSLNLKVIAEGVETEAQVNFLRGRGCDEIQGYYIGRPMPAEQAAQALREPLLLRLPRPAAEPDRLTVLLVDDNRDDLLVFHDVLSTDGYRVLMANHPRTALDLLTGESVDIVISDQSMPAMSGVRFLSAVRTLYPHALRIMLTGSAGPEDISDAVNAAGVHKFLSKHWDAERFSLEVREACRRHKAP